MAKIVATLTHKIPGEAPVTETKRLGATDVVFLFGVCGVTVVGLRHEDNGLRRGAVDPDSQRFTTQDGNILAKLQADDARMVPVRLCTNDHRVSGIWGHVNTNMIKKIRRVRGVYCKTVIAFYDGQEVIALEPEANLRQRIGRPAPA